MIRIWNYNKSRIHSYRGAKEISIQLDTQTIFAGQIAKAPGSLKSAEMFCEYIMFTAKEDIVGKLEKDDWLNKKPKYDANEFNKAGERPMTGTRRLDDDIQEINKLINNDERPLTTAKLAK